MAVQPILMYGNPLLHKKAVPVEKINDEIQTLVDNMFQTMIEARGIGLAAIQIGVEKSVIVIDLPQEDGDENNNNNSMLAMINPELIDLQGMCTIEEGCLSVPGINADIDRPETITVQYVNTNNETIEMKCSGLLARVIQHECDHLQGILFIKHLKPSVRKKLAPQLRQLAKGVEV